MTVYEQLAEYCDCLTAIVEDGDITSLGERAMDELIALVSSYTCWMQRPCETFLQSDRREVIDLKDCLDDCAIFEFEPFYTPFVRESFVFNLIEQNGITETSTPISTFIYSEADEKFRMELPLPSCKCRKPQCGCASTYKLVVDYVAGYEEIPECLLPFFCEALQMVLDRNKCDCEECQECDRPLSSRNEFDYTKLEDRLKEQVLDVLTAQYFRGLSMISLCKQRNYMWSVVV